MHDSYKKIPVVMLSSKEGLFDQAKAALAGSNEYMTKPFTRDEITEVVKKHLG
jgi:twitching motility two-component system response regulator PilG